MKTQCFESAWRNLRRLINSQKEVSFILATVLCGMFVTVGSSFSQSWQWTGAANNRWSSLAGSVDGTKLVAVAQSFIYASTNSGTTWFLTGAPSNSWTSVTSSADGINLIASAAAIYNPSGGRAYGGPIYTSTDSGATWQPTIAPSNQWSSVASSSDGSILVAAAAYNNSNTTYGLIFISTNSGTSWHESGAPTNRWYSVAATADGTRLMAGGGTNLVISTNSGATWTAASVPFDIQFAVPRWVSVASSADGVTLLAIQDNGGGGQRSYVSKNSGSTWISNDLPQFGKGFLASSADGSRLMVSMGHLYLSMDHGTTWVQQNIPADTYGYGSGCVACSADGGRLFLALGADDFGHPNSVYTLFSTPRPYLNLAALSSNLALSWIVPSTNFILLQNTNLTTTNWVEVTKTPTLDLTKLQIQVNLPALNGSGFYRLSTH